MFTREELEREGLTDFRVFLVHVWAFLGLPKPTKVQLDIAYWLQHGPNRAILQAFRGVGKSWITVAFVLWHLLLDPQKKIMVVSAGEGLASDFTKFCFQLIHGMPLLQHLAPRHGQRAKSDSFDVGPATPSKDPSVKSVGITGQLTGSRADIIVADDVETPKNSYTLLLRERLSELVKEFDAVLKPLKSSRIIYLGTPQVEESLYVKLRQRGYTTRIWPAQIPEDEARYSGALAPYVTRRMAAGWAPGTPLDPERFNAEDLAERLASYGRAGYALQFMLDTSPSDAEKHPLKLKNLMVMDIDPEVAPIKLVWSGERQYAIQDLPAGGFDRDHYVYPSWKAPEMAKYVRTTMAIDPSGKGTDETAYAIIKELHGYIFLVDIGGYLDGYGEATLQSLAGKAARWQVNRIIVEPNFGGGMFAELLRPHLQKVSRDVIDDEYKLPGKARKEDRILDTLAPVVENHRLVVSRKVIEEDLKVQAERPAYSFVYQYTRMSRIKDGIPHDDRIDALAMAVGSVTDRMSRDPDKMQAKFKEKALLAELKVHMKNLVGGRSFNDTPLPKARWHKSLR